MDFSASCWQLRHLSDESKRHKLRSGVVEFTPPPSQSARTYHRALAPTTVRSHLPFDHSHLVKSYGTAVPCRSKSTRHSPKLTLVIVPNLVYIKDNTMHTLFIIIIINTFLRWHKPSSLRPVSYCDLCRALSNTPTTVTWCQRQKLLATDMDCHACGRDMRLVKRKSPEGQGWRCPRKACRKEVTLRKNTFFAGSHLQLELILWLIHLNP